MQDNLARKLYDDEYAAQRQRIRENAQRQQEAEMRRAEKQARIANFRFYSKLSAVCVIIFALSMLIMTRYAKISELEREILISRNQYEELHSLNVTRKAQLEQSLDIDEVEKEAKERLGMVKPAKNQIIHIDVPVKDELNYTAPQKKNIMTMISEKIDKLMAYLH